MLAGEIAMFWYLTGTRPLWATAAGAAALVAAVAGAALLEAVELLEPELLEPQPANTRALPASRTGRTLFMAGRSFLKGTGCHRNEQDVVTCRSFRKPRVTVGPGVAAP